MANFNRLIASLTRVLKATDSENLRDLEDAVDTPVFADQFNQSDKGNKPRTPTGPAQSASGSGAEKMVSDYADGAEQTGISAAYEAFARELANQGKRVESVEKAVTAIAGLLSSFVKGERFPEDQDEKGDEDDEKDESAKSLPTMNVPALMRSLATASRDTGKTGLASPPNMTTVRKAGVSIQDILDQDNGSSYGFSTRMELASIQSAMANQDGGQMRSQHLNTMLKRASGATREVLMKAGVSF